VARAVYRVEARGGWQMMPDIPDICEACGFDIPSCICCDRVPACPYCGRELPDHANHAPYCGPECAIDAQMERRR